MACYGVGFICPVLTCFMLQVSLHTSQETFKKEMKKEREEVCRQWQQLRDEITRMEEMHKIQKVSDRNLKGARA